MPPPGPHKSSAVCSCGTNPVTQSEFSESEALGEIWCLKGKMFWHETNTLAAATVSKQTPGPRTQLLQQEFKQIHRAHVSVSEGWSVLGMPCGTSWSANEVGGRQREEGKRKRKWLRRRPPSAADLTDAWMSRAVRKLSHAAHCCQLCLHVCVCVSVSACMCGWW